MQRVSSMPRDIEKPRKTLRRGIHITEHKDYRINPEPLILREADFLLEEFLSPTKLRALTGTDDLQKITELEMIVDTSDTSLGNFGIYLQNMIQLKLNNSVIPRVRDLGTSLSHIRILWMARCCLNDLDGVTSLQSLEELYIAYNEIIELSALSMLENLKILDLESNIVDDLRQVEFLALCPKLRSLSLEGNPVCSEPQPDLEQENYDYRAEILKRLPKIEILDDEKTTKDARRTKELKRTDSSLLFQQDWSLIEECIASGMAPPDDKLICNQIESRPRSSNSPLSRPTSAYYRPRSASLARPGSASGFRPGSAARFDHLAVNRPNTDPIMLESMDKVDDAVSELTIGPAFQGNLSKILRARKNQQQQQQTNQEAANEIKDEVTSDCPKFTIKSSTHITPITTTTNSSLPMSNKPLMKELNEFKIEHNKKIEERKKFLQPQVLRIDDDDDIIENDVTVESSSDDDDNANRSYQANENKKFEKEQSIITVSDSYDDESILKPKSRHVQSSNFGFDESYMTNNYSKQSMTLSANSISPDKTESRLTTGDTGYRSNSAASTSSIRLLQNQSRTSSRGSVEDYQTKHDHRSPMRVTYEQPNIRQLSNTKTLISQKSTDLTTKPTSPKTSLPTKQLSLKELRNEHAINALPTLPKLRKRDN